MTTTVTDVDMRADGEKLRAVITVTRYGLPYGMPSPKAADVPDDIRDALREWLLGPVIR